MDIFQNRKINIITESTKFRLSIKKNGLRAIEQWAFFMGLFQGKAQWTLCLHQKPNKTLGTLRHFSTNLWLNYYFNKICLAEYLKRYLSY